MLLNELLPITCLNSIIKIEGINSNRIKKDLGMIQYSKNEYNQTESKLDSYDDIIKQYGENRVLNQGIENNCLVILIKIENES